jgi:translocation and assembly module TamA
MKRSRRWAGAAALAWAAAQAALAAGTADHPLPAAEPATAPPKASYDLEVRAPEPLRQLLLRFLDLARFRDATIDDAIAGTELDRLIAAAPAQARALLETEGYFSSRVGARREASTLEGAPPRVILQVEPGPRTTVVAWTLDPRGDLAERLDRDLQRAVDVTAELRRGWALGVGQPFTQAAWSDAKGETLARLRALGYPAATIEDTRADIDAASGTARLTVLVDSGPLYRLGPIQIEGLSRYEPSTVLNIVDFGQGDAYTEKRLLDLQERLGKVGLFDAVSVELDPAPETSQAAPVLVRLRESPLQQATVGGGYSANTGQRITLEHTHRRPMGLQAIVRNKLQLGRDERTWEGSITSHPLRGQYRALASAKYSWLDAGDLIVTSGQWRLGGTLDTERIERLFFGELLSDTARATGTTESARAVSGNYHLVWRDVDSVVLPTFGETANMQAGLGYAFSNAADNGVFGRAYGRFTLYRPFGERWYFTGRLELGHLQAPKTVDLPETLLFRAGGDESVRGYGFRTLGPSVNGVSFGGRMLATLSAEVARPVSVSLPTVWGAAFVDAGNAANEWRDLRPVVGYGLGVRWRSPVGPLRADLAYGHELRRFRVHVSVGIAF